MSLSNLSRKLFFRADDPLCQAFNTEDARFGSYMSKDVIGCRLKLDVKPVTINLPEGTIERLQFAFNFHRELTENNGVDGIVDLLTKWDSAQKMAFDIVNSIKDS